MRNLYFTNRKEYYRRKNISKSLKEYWASVDKERKRTRQQICYNSDYGLSFRAITFNSKFSKKDLSSVLDEFLNSNDYLQRVPFDTVGYEKEKIDDTEDKGLNSHDIFIELNIRGRTTLTTWKN